MKYLLLNSSQMDIFTISLQSGSSGNCIYVESGGIRLLFDAGISGIEAERRLASHNRNIRDVDALIISHDHSDHIRCAGIYQRKYGIPVYITGKTLAAAEKYHKLGRINDIHHFKPGDEFKIGRIDIQTIPTPHDGADGSAFVIDSGKKRLGILTDLGYPFHELDTVISSLDAVFIESNYDPNMLASGTYPVYLKRRIKGPGGHISNTEAAELLKRSASRRLKWACLAHLSGENNTPTLALRTHNKILNSSFPVYVASRYRSSGILKL